MRSAAGPDSRLRHRADGRQTPVISYEALTNRRYRSACRDVGGFGIAFPVGRRTSFLGLPLRELAETGHICAGYGFAGCGRHGGLETGALPPHDVVNGRGKGAWDECHCLQGQRLEKARVGAAYFAAGRTTGGQHRGSSCAGYAAGNGTSGASISGISDSVRGEGGWMDGCARFTTAECVDDWEGGRRV